MTTARIHRLRQTLFLPFEVTEPQRADNTSPLDWLAKLAALIEKDGSPWKRESETDASPDLKTRQDLYSEFVYFHPYVRRFLYSRDPSPIHVFSRKDVGGLRVEIPKGHDHDAIALDLGVDRIRLFAFDTGIAVLAVETCHVFDSTPESLYVLLDLQNIIRRIYPPYWFQEDSKWQAGQCPARAVWKSKSTGEIIAESESDFAEMEKHLNAVESQKLPPLCNHWSWLLRPFAFNGDTAAICGKQLLDERMPLMAWVTVENPDALTEGDFDRLTFVDERGPSTKRPYADGFLRGSFPDADMRRFFYDRFWGASTVDGQQPLTSRYLCSGYSFIVIGSTGDWFFNNVIVDHFRNHYLKIGLILQFQHASLLAISERMSEAVQSDPSGTQKDRKEFRRMIQRAHSDLIRFTHRYWFDEVSNQLQAKELYSWWRGLMGTEKLYQQVSAEVSESDTLLHMQSTDRQAALSKGLNILAAYGLAISIAVSFLGINVLLPQLEGWIAATCHVTGVVAQWWLSGFAIALALLVGLLSYQFIKRRAE